MKPPNDVFKFLFESVATKKMHNRGQNRSHYTDIRRTSRKDKWAQTDLSTLTGYVIWSENPRQIIISPYIRNSVGYKNFSALRHINGRNHILTIDIGSSQSIIRKYLVKGNGSISLVQTIKTVLHVDFSE